MCRTPESSIVLFQLGNSHRVFPDSASKKWRGMPTLYPIAHLGNCGGGLTCKVFNFHPRCHGCHISGASSVEQTRRDPTIYPASDEQRDGRRHMRRASGVLQLSTGHRNAGVKVCGPRSSMIQPVARVRSEVCRGSRVTVMTHVGHGLAPVCRRIPLSLVVPGS